MIFGKISSNILRQGHVRLPNATLTFCWDEHILLAFIRGLLENVGAEINPIRLIRRIQNGLEIPGLKEALIKILQDFHLQISLLEGCQTILNGDSSDFAHKLHKDQSSGFFITGTSHCDWYWWSRVTDTVFIAKTPCPVCSRPLQETPQALLLLFLCRHVVHAACVSGGDQIPHQPDPVLRGIGLGGTASRGLSGKIALCVSSSLLTNEAHDIFIPVHLPCGQGSNKAVLFVIVKGIGHDQLAIPISCIHVTIPTFHKDLTLEFIFILWLQARTLECKNHNLYTDF